MTDMQETLTEFMSRTPQNSDKRRHRRVHLPLPVRYMLPDKSEHTGVIENISASGALVRANTTADCGDRILIYIRQLGRFEATIVRVDQDSFAVSFKPRKARQQRTADTLAWLYNKGEKYLNRRVTQRIKQNKPATANLADGSVVPCRIIDISVTGAFIKIDPKPSIGEALTIGRMTARVVRHHNDGVGVEFMNTNTQ